MKSYSTLPLSAGVLGAVSGALLMGTLLVGASPPAEAQLRPTESTSAEDRAATPFRFENLKKLVQDADVRSIEGLLPLLPEELKRNFTLMHESRSLQAATPENPRAFLFNDDGSLVVSFNGHQTQRGGNRFEIMTFDDASARFEVKTIQFSADGSKAEIDEKPTNCFGCHGRIKDDLHPIWDPGLVWRGAYGSRDDSFALTKDANVDSEITSEITDEAKAYADFVSTAPTHERFKFLDFTNLVGTGDRSDIELRPNLRLGLMLTRQQAKRTARQIATQISGQSSPQAPNELRTVLAQVSGCRPPATEAAFRSQIMSTMGQFLVPIYGASVTDSFLKTEAPGLINAMFVGHSLGLDITEWPLTAEKRSYAIFDGSFSFQSLLTAELAKRLASVDSSFVMPSSFGSLTETELGLNSNDALKSIDQISRPFSATTELCSKL